MIVYLSGPRASDGRRTLRCDICGLVSAPTLSPPDKFFHSCGAVAAQWAETTGGQGSELTKILSSIGAKPDKCRSRCHKVARIMDRKGAEWCKANKPRLVRHLKKAYSKLNWSDAAAFAARALASGLAWQIGFSDPAEALVEMAIERAERKSHD